MDCNKEEAVRAKGIAEKRMQNDDFEGARKIALKAQQLFPELENISQLLVVCDVHRSAQNKIYGSERDWYGILQVERMADAATIKKQYRRLALVLHPDKNNFPGAEAAFKLIGEANMVLSDQGKRSLYDNKCRFSMRNVAPKPPPHQVNRNSYFGKQNGVKNNIPNVSNSQFSSLNHHQSTQPGLSNGPPSFWTCCPFCNMKYRYYKDFLNRALRCQNCSKPFIAYDLGTQMIPPSNMGSQGSFSSRSMGSEPVLRTGSTAEVGGLTKSKGKEDGKEGVGMPNPMKAKESGTSKSTVRKRGRKLVVESSESSDTASSNDKDVVIQKNGGNSAGQTSGLNGIHPSRRSARQRHNVSYNESLSNDDDFVSPPKRSRGSGSSHNGEEEQKEAQVSKTDNSAGFAAAADRGKEEIKQKGSAPLEGSLSNRNGEAGKHKVNAEVAGTVDCSAKKTKVTDVSESNLNSSGTPDPEYYECPDPEFSDFDKDKEENCFSVDQFWACYDTIDGMPRFYARVRKVFSPGFKLRITWLEPNPGDQCEIDWLNEGLPAACGKFILGSSEEATARIMFSHQIHCEKGSSRCSYVVYPRKGEIWALFKDWDIRWSSDLMNHKKYDFEIVEVVSDFVENAGIRVVYLDKVKGFVSLFHLTTVKGSVSFLIPSKQLLRFSHRIPSFKMTGLEREGVPVGSFELDPASLPSNLYEFCHHGNVKMETESVDAKVNGSCPKSPDKKMEPMIGSVRMNTPKKSVDFEGKNGLERETLKLRRSPRELCSTGKKHNQVNAGQCTTEERTANHLDGNKDKKHGDLMLSKGSASSCLADEKMHSPMKDAGSSSFMKSPRIPPSVYPACKISEEEFYNFGGDKSEGKFQLGQIWALYSNKDGLPKSYAQVKKIESSPFRLQVAVLEPCAQPKDMKQPVCCGMFKPQSGKGRVFSPSAFSHMLKVESIGKNRFEIYPREGEIWALYTNWNPNLTCSDLENCKYDIVEVLKDNGHSTKVSSLVRLSGFKSVFKAPRRQRSNTGIVDIPRVELARFSHQIPTFQLTGEKDGRLKGCWELDPASVPGNLFCVN
ncbi:hypothetical protein F0562_029403 [Nyssa sinensis]|uniref:J domain-containing protein n=1 Tax=Nyssa sinensis TaxID=561372 RepID=A0A5J5B0Y4_9ASTE|nr:hypothetical protein F0562_029403 [Nyssa sinensis]